jgi:hypothetical protein
MDSVPQQETGSRAQATGQDSRQGPRHRARGAVRKEFPQEFQTAALIAGLTLVALGAPTVHAQGLSATRHPYQISLPGTRVTWAGPLHTSGGLLRYGYNLKARAWIGFYGVQDGLRSPAAALASSAAQFRAARLVLRLKIGGAHLLSAQRASVWSIQDIDAAGCYVSSGTASGRSVFMLVVGANVCSHARIAATWVFDAIARRVGRHSPAGITWPAMPTAPTATATPVPAPTATPPARSPYLVQTSGDQNAASQTFYAAGTFTVSWTAAVKDTTYISSGYFSVELDSAQDNTILESIGTSTSGGSGDYLVHDDCSRGCYLKVYSSNMTYNITAQYTPRPPTATATPLPPTATATPIPTATATPVSTATATPVPPTATATPVPPTATATPQPHASVLVQMSGDQPATSATFSVVGTFTVTWTAAVEDPSLSGGFSVEVDRAQDNGILELIGATTSGGSGSYLVHDDCSRGCYLKVYSSNMTYNITAQ